MSQEIEHTIRESPLFKHLTEEELADLVSKSKMMEFGIGTTIITEDTSVDHLYIVLAGQVRVWTRGPRGEVELKMLGRGAYFGEVSLMSGNAATANVEVSSKVVQTVALERETVLHLVETDEKIRKMLQGVTLARAKDTIGKVFK